MKLSESRLRKIIREEIINEMGPIEFHTALTGAVGGPGAIALHALILAADAAGIWITLGPSIKSGIEAAKKKLGAETGAPATSKMLNPVAESRRRVIKEAADPVSIAVVLKAVAAMATGGVAVTVLSSFIEDAVAQLKIKPQQVKGVSDPEAEFFDGSWAADVKK